MHDTIIAAALGILGAIMLFADLVLYLMKTNNPYKLVLFNCGIRFIFLSAVIWIFLQAF